LVSLGTADGSAVVNPYPANVENMVSPNNASKWHMGFNSVFKGLWCCATNQKVAGSIPDGVIGIFH
jgi:hypothetical protein